MIHNLTQRLALLTTALWLCCQTSWAQTPYPATEKGTQTDDYFGTKVADPYRWLEDDNSEKTKDWVKRQNEYTNAYLAKIPFRDKLKTRLESLTNYARMSAPVRKGDVIFYEKNDGLQNQSVYYVQNIAGAEGEVLIDPNTMSKEGTVSLTYYPSPDGKYVAYAKSKGGSDWNEFYVVETATKKLLDDKIEWVKFSGVSWVPDGFFYSRYPAPEKGKEMTSSNENAKVYFHRIGTNQSEDILLFEDPAHPKRIFNAEITENYEYVILYGSEGASGQNTVSFIKAEKAEKANFKPIISEFIAQHNIIGMVDGQFLMETDLKAPKGKVVMVDPANPAPANWKTVVPESEHVLSGVVIRNEKLILTYLENVSNKVYIHDLAGKRLQEVKLPAIGTVSGFTGRRNYEEAYFVFTSFTYPSAIYKLNIPKGAIEVYFQPKVDFDPSAYETKQVFYPSKDGTKVPMFIVHKKGLVLNGDNPTLLYAYGGFNINLLPTFSVNRILLLENGGVYALANLRGGGEYGETWHEGGKQLKKQNVFDDFIAAAEYLIKEKYTSSAKLAIQGGSNGGLLVGACMTQRPDLYKVCFPAVGVLDMLRFHKFTIGWAWAPEYGSSDSLRHFKNLYKYSPLHNLKKGTAYPATFVTTADHDDRVVPAHSFKFAAELQACQSGKNPTLISIQTNAGHGAGKPISKTIEETANIYSFMFYNMGITPK